MWSSGSCDTLDDYLQAVVYKSRAIQTLVQTVKGTPTVQNEAINLAQLVGMVVGGDWLY